MITKAEIKKDLRRVYDLILKIPTKKEYRQYGSISTTTIQRRFKSWNEAILETFGRINHRSNVPKHIVVCFHCGKEIERREENLKEKNYCSVSCANKSNPKRKLTKQCEKCKTLIHKYKRLCSNCRKNYKKRNSIEDRKLGSFKHLKGALRYSQVREHAREKAKELPNICTKCGYDKHVEVCHKKRIPDFDNETLIKEINSIDNIIKLCKNCHWESHNGYYDINSL